tara:strand:- start:4 stop:657 length:654 start_codon:yes stop_codon:yes gene_type:complete
MKEFEKRILSSIILIPIALFFIIKGSLFFLFFLSIFFYATSYEWFKMNKDDGFKIIGIIYLLIVAYSAYYLRENFGLKIFIFIIIICIFTDIGGYIFGKLFKGPKLIKISPNKTYAGMIGGFTLSIIAGLIYKENISIYIYQIENLDYFYQIKNSEFLVITLLISAVSQIGDLIISYFKRLAKVKDTGKLLPGHGGLLDRVDGIIFAVPIFYLILTL